MVSQHYIFAHRALPSVIFSHSSQVLAILNGRDGDRFLADLWDEAGEYYPPDQRRAPEGLHVEMRRAGDNGVIAVIWLPAPQDFGEAHLIAIIAKLATPEAPSHRGEAESAEGGAPRGMDGLAYVRCFLLEFGINVMTEQPCTYLCEWTRDGSHRNLGRGPAVEERAFVEAIFDVLEREAGGA